MSRVRVTDALSVRPQQLGISDEQVEEIIVALILDDKIHGRIDQVTGRLDLDKQCVELFLFRCRSPHRGGSGDSSTRPRFDALPRAAAPPSRRAGTKPSTAGRPNSRPSTRSSSTKLPRRARTAAGPAVPAALRLGRQEVRARSGLELSRARSLGGARHGKVEGQRGCPLVAVCRPASLRLSPPRSSLRRSRAAPATAVLIPGSRSRFLFPRSPVVRNEGEIVKAMLKRDSSTATASVRPQAPRPSPPRAPPPRRLPARGSAEPACTTRSSATSRRAHRERGRGRTRR